MINIQLEIDQQEMIVTFSNHQTIKHTIIHVHTYKKVQEQVKLELEKLLEMHSRCTVNSDYISLLVIVIYGGC